MSTKASSTTSFSSQLQVIEKIGNSRYTVYRAFDPTQQKEFALKVYPFEKGQMSKNYQNEQRFQHLDHPNIIKMVHTKDSQKSAAQGTQFSSSIIIMEMAPYGDLTSLMLSSKIISDEKLVRSMFHQLISGIEYLHSQNIAHLDIKLDNLMIGDEFQVKVIDFDNAQFDNEDEILSRGSKNLRAPEIINGTCTDGFAADVYSAGIVLFSLMTGKLPYKESQTVMGFDMQRMFWEEDPRYWSVFETIANQDFGFSSDFKTLVKMMTKYDAVERATLNEIKNSKWFKGEVYSHEEYKSIMGSIICKNTILGKQNKNH